MPEATSTNVRGSRLVQSPILWFVIGAYLFSWTIWLSLRGHKGDLTWSIRGWTITLASYPAIGILGILGTFGPGISAIIITGLEKGRKGINELWIGLGKWRLQARWFGIALLLFPFLGALTLLLFGLVGGEVVSPGNPVRWFRLLILNLPLGPLWEELGWRAFLLNRLQTRRSPLLASIIIGAIWGPWHLLLHSRTSLEFEIWFLIMVVAVSVLFTWVFNRTKASLAAVILMHSAFDATTFYLLAPTIDAQGILLVRVEAMTIVCAALVTLFFAGPELGRDSTPSADVSPGRESQD